MVQRWQELAFPRLSSTNPTAIYSITLMAQQLGSVLVGNLPLELEAVPFLHQIFCYVTKSGTLYPSRRVIDRLQRILAEWN